MSAEDAAGRDRGRSPSDQPGPLQFGKNLIGKSLAGRFSIGKALIAIFFFMPPDTAPAVGRRQGVHQPGDLRLGEFVERPFHENPISSFQEFE